MNDPNGLVWHNGLFHAFYQHNPADIAWGPMHWGHAVSIDLLHWEHRPIALAPDALGAIFSGSAVVDVAASAGFGAGAIVASFTHHQATGDEYQSLAFSTDNGLTWEKYSGNPVLRPPPGAPDFRDPKIFWCAARARWVMLLAVGREIWFYDSADLRSWQPLSTFSADIGAAGAVWETPDMFELPIEGSDKMAWVLTIGIADGAPAGGSGTAYVVGQFDGRTFAPTQPASWADWGPDFYAPQSWFGDPLGRTVWIGWVYNWVHPPPATGSQWRGQMSVPRQLSLVGRAEGIGLRQWPVTEAIKWDQAAVIMLSESGGAEVPSVALDLVLLSPEETRGMVLTLERGPGSGARIGYDGKSGTLTLSRQVGGGTWEAVGKVSVGLPGRLELRVLVDVASVEVFVCRGLHVMTASLGLAQCEHTTVSVRHESGAMAGDRTLQGFIVNALGGGKEIVVPVPLG